MKKGVSTVIAVVLLLLITVGIVWSVYTWLTGTMTEVTKETGEAIERQTEILTTDFMIVAAGYKGGNRAEVSISNTGTRNIDLTKIKVYVKGINQDIQDQNKLGELKPGETKAIEFQNSTPVCGEVVRVAYAGIIKEATIEC